MAKCLACFFLFASCLSASTFGYVQSASQSGNTALAFPSPNTPGNAILVFTSIGLSGTGKCTLASDTQGNVYGELVLNSQSPAGMTVWVAQNIKAGANSVSCAGLNASGGGSSIAIIEVQTPMAAKYVVSTCMGENGTGGPFACSGNLGSNYFVSQVELFAVLASYDANSAITWTGTNLTIRETTTEVGPATQTLGVGTNDYASGVALGTASTINGCNFVGSHCSYAGIVLTGVAGSASPGCLLILR